MGNYTIFWMFENPRRGRLARNFAKNVQKILDLKSSSEQIFSENCRWVPLMSNLRARAEKIKKPLFKQTHKATFHIITSLGVVYFYTVSRGIIGCFKLQVSL